MKSRKVSVYGVTFTHITFPHLMSKIRKAISTRWVLTEFEGDINDYIPNPDEKYQIRKLCFWMKQEGINYFQHFAMQTNLKNKIKHIEVVKDTKHGVDNFDIDSLIQDYERVNAIDSQDAAKHKKPGA